MTTIESKCSNPACNNLSKKFYCNGCYDKNLSLINPGQLVSRTFLGKQITADSELLNPNQLLLDEFVEQLSKALKIFNENLKSVKSEKFIEEWFEIFLAWLDVKQNSDDFLKDQTIYRDPHA